MLALVLVLGVGAFRFLVETVAGEESTIVIALTEVDELAVSVVSAAVFDAAIRDDCRGMKMVASVEATTGQAGCQSNKQ